MMEEISLTGATLTSDSESSPASDVQSRPQPNSHPSHSHSHNHGRSHGGSYESGGYEPPPAPPQVPDALSIEKMMELPHSEVFKGISTLVRFGHYETLDPIVKTLLEKKGSAAKEILETVGEDGHSLLHWAAKRVDDLRFLELICPQVSTTFINVPSQGSVGMTPLHWACVEGSVPHIAVLLRYGAKMEAPDKSGCTPLLIASQYGHVELVAYLLQKGADGKAVDKSRDSALHWAAYKGSIHVCGLLLFRGELCWTTADAFGQTPLHLASLRGHTTTVRYLLQEGTRAERKQVLFSADKNDKTPLDLAIHRKRPTVEAVLREAMEMFSHERGSRIRQLQSTLRQFFSWHSWKIWIGCNVANDEVDEAPKLPFYWFIVHLLLYTGWYPFVFLPVNQSQGVMYDMMWWHSLNIFLMVSLYFTLYKTHVTNPGTLDEKNPKTRELRQEYERTLESYADEDSFSKQKAALCHTCHIARPLRSKHCRASRRCVLLFDHHCPFVGNTVGLYNYKWFYMMLVFLTLVIIGFGITFGIYLHRAEKSSWALCLFGSYLCLYIMLGGGLLIYHTQLSTVNLTTNEHQNMRRYKYLQNERGQYKNQFFRGPMRSYADRCFPGEHTYTLPGVQQALLPGGQSMDRIV